MTGVPVRTEPRWTKFRLLNDDRFAAVILEESPHWNSHRRREFQANLELATKKITTVNHLVVHHFDNIKKIAESEGSSDLVVKCRLIVEHREYYTDKLQKISDKLLSNKTTIHINIWYDPTLIELAKGELPVAFIWLLPNTVYLTKTYLQLLDKAPGAPNVDPVEALYHELGRLYADQLAGDGSNKLGDVYSMWDPFISTLYNYRELIINYKDAK